MVVDFDRRAEILVFDDHAGSLGALCDALRLEQYRVDTVDYPAEARARFLEAGGHAVLVLAPGLPDAVAAQTASALHAVDPGLCTIRFGIGAPGAGWPESGVVRLGAHHPASRAALGAVLRVLTTAAI